LIYKYIKGLLRHWTDALGNKENTFISLGGVKLIGLQIFQVVSFVDDFSLYCLKLKSVASIDDLNIDCLAVDVDLSKLVSTECVVFEIHAIDLELLYSVCDVESLSNAHRSVKGA
jgi:hypothetical protein